MSKTKAFQGANGWYVATETPDGFHHQPADGGHLSEAYARAEAEAANSRDSEDAPEYWGGTETE